jgi:hypothetical protein
MGKGKDKLQLIEQVSVFEKNVTYDAFFNADSLLLSTLNPKLSKCKMTYKKVGVPFMMARKTYLIVTNTMQKSISFFTLKTR